MRKHLEDVKDYIFNNLSESGVFSKRYSEIATELNISQQDVRNAFLQILKEGIVEVIEPPKKGKGSNPIYKIKNHKVEINHIHPTEQYDGESKVVIFEGVEVKLIMTELGYALSKEDLAICTLENVSTLDKIISSNPELFKDHITVVNGKDYIDKAGVVTYMLKVNLDKVHPIKRELIYKFQSQIISIMCESTLRARLHITEDHRIKIRHNLNCILELDSSQVEDMLTDLEYQISKKLDEYNTKLVQTIRNVRKLEKKNEQLNNRVEVEMKAKELLITESQELRAKLLDRD